ncbi:MAG TPA: alpha/beta hydrolase-fold protein [Solirubrobacteraceae bacterium]|nr:alpha/beta hydrolase-fold protein [Solirubrobacteraceae bacterium]
MTAETRIDPVSFRVPDPDHRYAAVRLRSDLPKADFTREGDEWVLEVDLGPLDRLEYLLELELPGGDRELIGDPAAPDRAPGAFGEKSVVQSAGYEPPGWLATEPVPGETTELAPRGRGLRGTVPVRIWSPSGGDATALPLLVANDGPEYDALSSLTHYAGAMIAAGDLPPFRVAMLGPGHRDEWYSGSAHYARALATDVLPVLEGAVPVGMGASLGGLAMLHAHARRGVFAGMFLQSGSFFVPRHDAHESRFPRYRRIVRVVRELHRDAGPPVPTALTCGVSEENLANNRLMARALATQGFDATLHVNPDLHNYTGWRDTFHPHLTRLLAAVWG